jgi:hypothetical protein
MEAAVVEVHRDVPIFFDVRLEYDRDFEDD